MTEDYSKLLFFNLLAFSFTINANEVRSEMDFFRKKESRIELRNEFVHCVRPMFLKYLLHVDKKTMDKYFSKEDKDKILAGFVPKDWSVHHQKPLSWGGWNFNPEMIDKIHATPLTKEQENECLNCSYEKDLRFRYQIDNFLSLAQRRGRLEKTFTKLFRNHLILLPNHIHTQLEDGYLMPQVDYISDLKGQCPSDLQNKAVLAPLHHLIWDQFVYQGQHFSSSPKSKIKKVKEDYKKKGVFKRKTAYLKQHRQRTL